MSDFLSDPAKPALEMQFGTIICLGRGNNMETGVSPETIANAKYAGKLSLTHLVDGGTVITSGLGPERLPYLESEADAMAATVLSENPRALVIPEPYSTDTFKNIFNSSKIFPEDVQRIGIVGTRGHAQRAAGIARLWLGPELTVTPLPSDVPVSLAGLALEQTLSFITRSSMKGVVPGDTESFLEAASIYQRRIARIKGSPLRQLHSGRR